MSEPVSLPPNLSKCAMCDKPAKSRCSRCASQAYCGEQCQRLDWRVHKLLCASRPQFETRPTPNHRRAVFFHEKEPKVEFVWIEIEPQAGYDKPLHRKFMGTRSKDGSDDVWITQELLCENHVRKRPHTGTLHLYHRDNAYDDGVSKDNQGVLHATRGLNPYRFVGPLLVINHETPNECTAPERDPPAVDMDMRDFRDIMDHFFSYPYDDDDL